MGLTMLLADTNNLASGIGNAIIDVSGGDMILVGIIFIIVVALFLMMSNARSGLVIVIAMALIFLLSLVNPLFMGLYWIALIIGIVLVIIGLKDRGR